MTDYQALLNRELGNLPKVWKDAFTIVVTKEGLPPYAAARFPDLSEYPVLPAERRWMEVFDRLTTIVQESWKEGLR